MLSVTLDKKQVRKVRSLASGIARDVQKLITKHSTVSVERATLRLYGVNGVDVVGIPLPNRVVEELSKKNDIKDGVTLPFVRTMLLLNAGVQETAERIAGAGVLEKGDSISMEALTPEAHALARKAVEELDSSASRKQEKRTKWVSPPQPWRYVIAATGNIYEDREQAKSAVHSGADIIAVIRSTAQSLLDYVPYGPTTEGFGGTYATQENFKIMRTALDEASERAGRYVRLVNYASGLCMPEIAVCSAFEDLDVLLNDSMYGILFRDINMKRTFVDQYFSRLLSSRAGIMINTGEDNYLTTADAIDSAHTVTSSQLINEAMAKKALLPDHLIGLGHAFEIDPAKENAFLYELAHALLARSLFPNAPLKYMPPTKHKSTDIFFSHAMDTMFNLASVLTGQGIHLAGMPTEAIHTPLMQERYQSLKSVEYVFTIAKDLANQIEITQDSFITKRAHQVLGETEELLQYIKEKGLMTAIEEGKFANIKRAPEEGRGLDGVFKKKRGYFNPVLELLEEEGRIQGAENRGCDVQV